MSDKDIIKALKGRCCSECTYQTSTVIECECTGCEFKEAVLNCIAMLRKKVEDRTPFE